MPAEPAERAARRAIRGGLRLTFIAALAAGAAVAGLMALGSPHPAVPRPAALPGAAARRPNNSARATAEAPRLTGRPGPLKSPRPAGSRPSTPHVSEIDRSGSFLIIPALDVRAPLVPTGALGAPGAASLSIPADTHKVGWWDGMATDGGRTAGEDAPAPGQPGVALIAGHVDSAAAGPGALYYLATMKVGQLVKISDSAGRVSTWVVDAKPQTTLKTQLPSALWVTTGAPKLALVTCGGPFDYSTGHYLDNVIVWARQLGSR